MEFILPPGSTNEEACLITISTIARRYARKRVPLDVAEELTQDVILECLVHLRAGRRWTDTTSLTAYVRKMVRRRANDSRRYERRRSRNATGRLQDLTIEGLELLSFHARSLARLSNSCRRACRMVREDKASYVAVDVLALRRRASLRRWPDRSLLQTSRHRH
jgi:DNA-directed RNA polymerase specialized sigma24 family protein